MTPTELKENYQLHNPDGHFFDDETMRCFGDSMANYGVRQTEIVTWSDPTPIKVWELYRKEPVSGGLSGSAYFEIETFRQRHAKK